MRKDPKTALESVQSASFTASVVCFILLMQSDHSATFDFRLVPASGILLLAVCLAWWLDARRPEAVALIPSLTGQPEYCLTCHADLPEISPSHPIQVFGCVSCHGGERLSLDADLAHSTMRGGANPSDLSVAGQSCGGENCHSGASAQNRDHIQRVETSLQSTYAGAIASIRYTFGAQPDLTARLGVFGVTDSNRVTKTGLAALAAFDPAVDGIPAIGQFAENCLTCHLNAVPRDGRAFLRFTGCAACHSPGTSGMVSQKGEVHRLTTAIPYTQCNTCHNRGNYDLRQMVFVERSDQPADRLHAYYQPISQFTRCEYTLDCVDCHTRAEAMGDGDLHSTKKEIQYIQCQTCHGTLTSLPLTRTLSEADELAFKLAQLNPVVDLKAGDSVLVTGQGELLWNTRVLSQGAYRMVGKVTRQVFNFRPVKGSGCTQTGEDQTSAYCHQCHSVQREPDMGSR